MHEFVYNQLKERADELVSSCRQVLNPNGARDDVVRGEDSRLKMAFVGQYNAGKSSLVKMLTGIEDIPIGSNVTTDKSKEYNYKGLHIVDTPGIRAIYSLAHDKEAFNAISKADLLVFVITNELFDDVLASEFRKLCFEQRRENEILLVINKSQSDAGSKQTKLDAIAPILAPLIPESFPIVFVDAASYFEALDEEDPTEQEELFELSNRAGLIASIDEFVAQRGLYARLTTPLQIVQAELQSALEKMQVANPLEAGSLSLMRQIKRLLEDSRRNFEKCSVAALDDAHSKIVREGSSLAALVGGSSDEFTAKQTSAAAVCERAGTEAITAINDQARIDLQDLEDSLSALAKTPMAKQIMDSLGTREPVSEASPNNGAPTSHNPGDDKPFNIRLGKDIAEQAQKGLSFLVKSSVGNSVKEGLRGVSGSALHETVKKVGELIGYKFKAWEALKIADNIGKGAKFLGPVMAVAGIGMQIYSDKKESDVGLKMTAARREIRQNFWEYAEKTKTHLSSVLGELITTGYDDHINSVNEAMSTILSKDAEKSLEKQVLVEKLSRIADFTQEVQAHSPWQ